MSAAPDLPAGFPVQKTYLGDSVYCRPGRCAGEWILTTENGKADDPSNVIYLEDQVVRALLQYIERGQPAILAWLEARDAAVAKDEAEGNP